MSVQTAPASSSSYLTWQFCLGHLNIKILRHLHQLGHIKILIDGSDEVAQCQICIRGKMSIINMSSRAHHRVTRRLEIVHSDLCQLPWKCCQGSQYMMLFVETFTHPSLIYVLKYKHEAFDCFNHYAAYAERETREKLRCIRTKNGGEYTSDEWALFCEPTGV